MVQAISQSRVDAHSALGHIFKNGDIKAALGKMGIWKVASIKPETKEKLESKYNEFKRILSYANKEKTAPSGVPLVSRDALDTSIQSMKDRDLGGKDIDLLSDEKGQELIATMSDAIENLKSKLAEGDRPVRPENALHDQLRSSYERYESLLLKGNEKARIGNVGFPPNEIKESVAKIRDRDIGRDIGGRIQDISEDKAKNLIKSMDLEIISKSIEFKFSNIDVGDLVKPIPTETLEQSLFENLKTVIDIPTISEKTEGSLEELTMSDLMNKLDSLDRDSEEDLDILSQASVIMKEYMNLDVRSSRIIDDNCEGNFSEFMDSLDGASGKSSEVNTQIADEASKPRGKLEGIEDEDISTNVNSDRTRFSELSPDQDLIGGISAEYQAELDAMSDDEDSEIDLNETSSTVDEDSDYKRGTGRPKLEL